MITFFFCICILGGLVFSNFNKDILVFIILILLLWLSIAIHEIGHIIFGIKSGFTFNSFIIGFIKIESTSTGIKFKENTNWLSAGGVTVMSPPVVSKEKILNKQIVYSLGGPMLSFLFFLISVSLYYINEHILLLYFSLVNLAIFLVTIIPTGKEDMGSDGYFIVSILKNPEKSLELVENLSICRELISSKKPNEWSLEYICLAKKKPINTSNIMYITMLYYYEMEFNGFYCAKEVMNDLKKIEINKDNKELLAVFIHMQQIEAFLTPSATNNLSKIKCLQNFLTPREPVSFYRGQAIINCLQQERQQAIKDIRKVNKVIIENQDLYGFLQTEKKITKLVEKKMQAFLGN